MGRYPVISVHSTDAQNVRTFVFDIAEATLPQQLRTLLPVYRRMVNQAIRVGLTTDTTSRAGFNRIAYGPLAAQYKGLSSYVRQAIGDARALLRAHRKRQRRGGATKIPFVTRLFIKVGSPSFHLDVCSGNLRISVGNGVWVRFRVPVSDWHRGMINTAGAKQIFLTIKADRVSVTVSFVPQATYEPGAILALDTNEESLDGVHVAGESACLVSVPLGDIRAIQARHFVRRRKRSSKKAGDRRVKRRLLSENGRRERHRARGRLHCVSKGIVAAAKESKAAIVLEDLTGIRRTLSPRMNRRLSAWPHRELHRQVSYKAQTAGVPVLFVNRYRTSQRCAACGWTPSRSKTRNSARSIDGMYACGNPECGWKVNRQFNAGINILRTALTDRPGLGGVRFHLDALSRDVMNPLCAPARRAAWGERMEGESRIPDRELAHSLVSTAGGSEWHAPES
jgi:IS605 OrfB family transposase